MHGSTVTVAVAVAEGEGAWLHSDRGSGNEMRFNQCGKCASVTVSDGELRERIRETFLHVSEGTLRQMKEDPSIF